MLFLISIQQQIYIHTYIYINSEFRKSYTRFTYLQESFTKQSRNFEDLSKSESTAVYIKMYSCSPIRVKAASLNGLNDSLVSHCIYSALSAVLHVIFNIHTSLKIYIQIPNSLVVTHDSRNFLMYRNHLGNDQEISNFYRKQELWKFTLKSIVCFAYTRKSKKFIWIEYLIGSTLHILCSQYSSTCYS